MKYATVFLAVYLIVLAVPARAQIAAEKRAEIDSLVRITGLEQLMNQMKDQILSSMKSNPNVPPALMERMSAKLDVKQVLEKIVPIYDKYYSLEDLRAINAFYSSAAGQRILKTLPQVMQESMAAGQEWGQRAAAELQAELTAESGKKSP